MTISFDGIGRTREANRANERAVQSACTSPRGYPYGIGTGEILEWGIGRRTLLLLDDGGLVAALPEYYQRACESLAREAAHAFLARFETGAARIATATEGSAGSERSRRPASYRDALRRRSDVA